MKVNEFSSRLLLAATAFSFTASICAEPIMTIATGQAAVLQLSPPGHQTFTTGRGPMLSLHLRNVSGQDLWINDRMLINSAYAPKPMREVWFDVRGPDGERIEFNCKVRAGPARADNYRVLLPNDAREVQVVLGDCFDIGKTGAYTVQASYEDGSETIPASPTGARHLNGRLVSNVVQIEALI